MKAWLRYRMMIDGCTYSFYAPDLMNAFDQARAERPGAREWTWLGTEV